MKLRNKVYEHLLFFVFNASTAVGKTLHLGIQVTEFVGWQMLLCIQNLYVLSSIPTFLLKTVI